MLIMRNHIAGSLYISPTWLMGLEDQTPDKNLIASQVIVIEQIQKCFGSKMVELLSYANELNEEGLNQALNQIEQLTEIKRFQKEGVIKKE